MWRARLKLLLLPVGMTPLRSSAVVPGTVDVCVDIDASKIV